MSNSTSESRRERMSHLEVEQDGGWLWWIVVFFLIEHIGEGVVSPKNPYMEPMCFQKNTSGVNQWLKFG